VSFFYCALISDTKIYLSKICILDDTDSGQVDELIASKSFERITEPDCPEGTIAVWYSYYDYWKWECLVVE